MGREKGQARRRYSGLRGPLSRYWNGKWNIRNKSCKTPFSRDNAVSTLWTLARVGRAYCATLGRRQGGGAGRRTRNANSKPVSLKPMCSKVFRLSFSDFSVASSSKHLSIFLSLNVLHFGSATPATPVPSPTLLSPSWTSRRLSWSLRATSARPSLSCPGRWCPSSPFSFLLSVCFASIHETVRESVSLGKYQRRAGDLCKGWS